MRWLVAAIVLAAAPAGAAPDTRCAPEPGRGLVEDNSFPASCWYPRIAIGGGIGFMTGDVGALSPTGPDVLVHGELRLTTLSFVRVTLEHAWLTARDDILVRPLGAELDAAQLAIRHAIMSFGGRPLRFGGDLSVQGGISRQRIAWDDGDTLYRTQAVLGFGGAIMLYDRAFRPGHVIAYSMRFLVGPAPDPGKLPAGCDGPCDMPTKTAPFDKSFVMELSWYFGR
jgi:hypothetical protein